jgi:tetratricopeptide (TPR) repeat protein
VSGGGAGPGVQKRVSLEQVSVPRLLFALLHQRVSGTLVVEQPAPYAGLRSVWLRGGMPVLTDWVAPGEVLGQVLVAQGLVEPGPLQQALEAMGREGGLLGAHLVAMGAIDRPRLLDGLRQQCTRKLLQLFALGRGEAVVTVGEVPGLEPDLLPVNVLGLVLAGVGVTYDEVRVAAEMRAAPHAPLRATAALARYRSHFHFRPADEPVLAALEAGSSLAALTALPGVGPRRAAQLVYTLWACQMLRTGAAADAAAPAPPAAARPAAPPAAPTAAPPPTAAAMPPAPAAASVPEPRTHAVTLAEPEAAAPGDAFMAELEALEAKVAGGAHAFALFGLELSAGKRELRAAWGELSRKFHPDALASQGRGHLRERVSKVFAALSEAQQVLGDAAQRDTLRAAIEKGEHESRKDGQDATARAHAVFQSELLAKEADKLLRANRFDRALDRYREAARYDAEEPDLKAAIAWCEYQLSPKSPADAARIQAALAQVIEQAPRIARAHYFLGFVLADQGRARAAVQSFRTASQLDPRLIDAERQARAIELRARSSAHAAASSARSGLKGLFGGGKK